MMLRSGSRRRVMTCGAAERVGFALRSTRDCINEAAERLMAALAGRNLSENVLFDLKLAVQEAVVNAVEHGNRCNEEKRVHVVCEADGEAVTVMVRDEGEGFDPGCVPDPTRSENILKEHGRGIFLMRNLCDEVRFNRRGNQVTLVKRLVKTAKG